MSSQARCPALMFALAWLLAMSGYSQELPNATGAPADASSVILDGSTGSVQRVSDAPSIDDPLNQPLSLAPRGSREKKASSTSRSTSPGLSVSTMVGGLAFCSGAFLFIVWATRRHMPKSVGPLPSEVIESLGRMPLTGRQQLQLIRLGKKLVLLNVSASGAEPLAEIDDADEVIRLTGLCQQGKPNSVTATFREVLGQYAREPAAKGFLGDTRQSDVELANRGVRRRPERREDVYD